MSNEILSQVSVQQLKQVIALREKIEALEAQITEILGGKVRRGPGRPPAAASSAAAAAPAGKKPRRKMSAAARKRIAAIAKARWAKAKAAGRTTLKGG